MCSWTPDSTSYPRDCSHQKQPGETPSPNTPPLEPARQSQQWCGPCTSSQASDPSAIAETVAIRDYQLRQFPQSLVCEVHSGNPAVVWSALCSLGTSSWVPTLLTMSETAVIRDYQVRPHPPSAQQQCGLHHAL